MAMPRKPDYLHDLQGTKPQHKDGVLTDEQFIGGRLKMPANYPPEKQAVWKLLFTPLQKRKTLTKGDSAAATIIVEMWCRWQTVSALAAANPIIEVSWLDKNGDEHFKQVESPASKMSTSLEHKLLAALKEFSATPASREKTRQTKEPVAKVKEAPSETVEEQGAREAAAEAARITQEAADLELLNSIDETQGLEPKTESQLLMEEADRLLAEEI